jgi:uncharacterized protein
MACSCNTGGSPTNGHAPLVVIQDMVLPSVRKSASEVLLAEEEKNELQRRYESGFNFLPVELFKTKDSYYVFDARNVTFFKVDRVAFEVFATLRERNASPDELVSLLNHYSESEVRQASEGLFEAQKKGFLSHYDFRRAQKYENHQYEEILSERMGGFTVFITTKCNLGCSYCIYGGQYEQHEELSQTAMPWETVQNTMTFLREHSKKSKQVRLDFFGGEPLLAFETIKRGVEYLKSIIGPEGPKVVVTITSNGTVITDKILNFLLEHNVFLQFSIDGSQRTHDQNRTFKNSSQGSFEQIFKNLNRIYTRDADYFRRNVRLKGVITTETLTNDDVDFFDDSLIQIILQEGHFTFLNLEPNYDLSNDADYFDRLRSLGGRLLEMTGLENETDILKQLNVRQGALYRHTFGIFFSAQALGNVYFHGLDSVPFTKACLTGYQEGAVSPSGDISICLKSAKGENFVIGNVNEGKWYYEKIRNLNTTFHRDWAGCSSCYLQKMCDLCYEKVNGVEGRYASGRRKFCDFNRAKHRTIFEYMLQVAENNPKLWEYLENLINAEVHRNCEESEEQDDESSNQHFGSRNLLLKDDLTD